MNLKKFLASSAIGAVAFGAVAAYPFAAMAQEGGFTVISGTVYNGVITNPVPGVTVKVTCNGGNEQTTTTGGDGSYAVDYDQEVCANGDSASATVGSVTRTRTVHNLTANIDFADIDIPVSQVPEFGLIPGAFAAMTSVGAFLGLRRRKKVL